MKLAWEAGYVYKSTPDARRAWKAGQWNAAEGRCHPCILGIAGAAELDCRDHWLLVERPRGEQRRACSLDQAGGM